ncbi:ATP synthase F1 subunit gamma [Clostridium tetanomorphum]|uniref:ATP synthase gamma chain n=1 Tax=Clostridium tetanomorphum TaxID=1553 RepID=A0A923EDE2_CLOTT|nr:ATP synthase F1 subunit gamma [Clostridium tetanomorphum]MBC2399376.1 ATP synthase F1 subunit gamma [Clostridium tetanomorphum]NRZ99410.1 F-type H+-transporting ATPase subunit gamma [Clostridium tetanomorphum]
MASIGLIGIRRRMKSVTNTQKITKAMGIVATSKLKKSRERLDGNINYYNYVKEIKNYILKAIEGKNIYIDGNKNGKKLYICITSNLGLCGGYNVNAVNETINKLIKDKKNSILMVVGKKGKNYFNKFKINVEREFLDLGEEPDLEDMNSISNLILNMYTNKDVSSVYVIYTKFLSSVKQVAETKKILPLEVNENNDLDHNFEFEIDPQDMLENIIETYLDEELLNLLLNSKSSEHAARMTAMDAATKNAKDILDKLNTEYNRIRQSAITEEISEIIGGAEAQK